MRDPPGTDLFRRLRPVFGARVDALWVEYQTANVERKREIEGLLSLVAAKRFGMPTGEDTLVLDPPPADLIGNGDYTLGNILYPGLRAYPVRVRRNELLRHIFILGPTGTGKSTFIIGLLRQLLTDRVPFMVFDFKRNYRCLLSEGGDVLVLTVGRDTAPLRLNALEAPEGVAFEEWAAALSDIISTAYLLMQGARNVLAEALVAARREDERATLRHAHDLLAEELLRTRAGSRRYGWLESSTRALDEVSKGSFGRALGAINGVPLGVLLERPVVFELEGLGEDQRTFFCLLILQAVLLLRKQGSGVRESLRHVLVFDESHNIFPKERLGELGVPSRLAREVREYGEAVVAATQQTDVSESLIANAGIKVVFRTDFPRDVQFAAGLMQVEPRFLSRLTLGTGVCRLPVRYYSPFLFTFPEQTVKNVIVPDAAVRDRWTRSPLGAIPDALVTEERPLAVSEKEDLLLRDVNDHPISTVTRRYDRLGWNAKTGNAVKDDVIRKGLAVFSPVTTPTGVVKILGLTEDGEEFLRGKGVLRERGRHGGPEHEYWKAVLREKLERLGFIVTEEAPVGGGKTVDLHGKRLAEEIWVEVETGRSDIPANVEKLRALPGTRMFVFTTKPLRDEHASVIQALGANAVALTTADPLPVGSLPDSPASGHHFEGAKVFFAPDKVEREKR